jgi:NitT/TauT family transport system substrate-binding protein
MAINESLRTGIAIDPTVTADLADGSSFSSSAACTGQPVAGAAGSVVAAIPSFSSAIAIVGWSERRSPPNCWSRIDARPSSRKEMKGTFMQRKPGMFGRVLASRGVKAATLASVVVLTAVGCAASTPHSSSSSTPHADAPAPATVTIATPTPPGTPSGIPIWIGEKNGYFADENLTVKIVPFPGQPAEAVAAVSAGQADLVISSPDALIVPTAKGTDLGLKWVFTPYQAPSFVIAVKAGSDIKSMKDLQGKKVAMPSAGAPFETFMDANIRGDGGDPSGVTVVSIATDAGLQALSQGTVDAVVANIGDLALADATAGYKTTQLPLALSVEKWIGPGFMMRSNATKVQRDADARYLRAYLKSALFARENPEAAVKMSWELYPQSKPTSVSESVALRSSVASLEATTKTFLPGAKGVWGGISASRWKAYVATLGFASEIPAPSVLYDNSLLPTINNFDAATVKADAATFGTKKK